MTYIAIASVVGTIAWQAVLWIQEREAHIETQQEITDNANYGLNDLNHGIARAIFPPRIIAAPVGEGPFENTHCLEITKRNVTGSNVITTYWFGLDSPTQRYRLYKSTTGCNVIPSGASLTDALFVKKDNSRPFFILSHDLIQFNFKAYSHKAGFNYEIPYNQANATQHFMKLNGSLGCKITTANTWFNEVMLSTHTLDVQITEHFNADLDQLKYRFNGVSILCGVPTAPTILYDTPVSRLSCAFDTISGTLNFTSTVPISSSDWAQMVANIEYAPATETSSASLKGARRTLNFSLANVSQGSMTLDLYSLARSCADENFTP